MNAFEYILKDNKGEYAGQGILPIGISISTVQELIEEYEKAGIVFNITGFVQRKR